MVEGPKGGNTKKMTNPAKNIAYTALGMKEGEGGEGGCRHLFFLVKLPNAWSWVWLIKCEKKSRRQQNGALELVRAFYPGWCSSSCQSLLSSATYPTSPPPRSPTLSGSQSQPFHPLLRQRGRFSPGLWLAWWRYSINNGGQWQCRLPIHRGQGAWLPVTGSIPHPPPPRLNKATQQDSCYSPALVRFSPLFL